jgi:hypothetical protein
MRPRRNISVEECSAYFDTILNMIEREDIVIEEDGMPVAMLVAFTDESAALSEDRYERMVGKRGDPSEWPAMLDAMQQGWAGIDAEQLIQRIYRDRDGQIGA